MAADPKIKEEAFQKERIRISEEIFESIDWDGVILDLRRTGGVATVHLPQEIASVHKESFQTARRALDDPGCFRAICQNEDSAHATGYHSANSSNSMSRYNSHREGFVFSNGQIISSKKIPEFEEDMKRLEASLHCIAERVLLAYERFIGIDRGKVEKHESQNRDDTLECGWFQSSFGPMKGSSQWHVKRYVDRASEVKISDEIRKKDDNEEPVVLLPVHTDPSLVSVVIHDAPGTKQGACGLQYASSMGIQTCEENIEANIAPQQHWIDVPYHGHSVATIFIGSVMSLITGGKWPCLKHRVIREADKISSDGRMAATLFVRPQPEAILCIPPSKKLNGVSIKQAGMTFGAWNARVSKNYMRRRKRK